MVSRRASCPKKKLFRVLCVLCSCVHFGLQVHAQDFVLREHLGRMWSQELVTFPLNSQQLTAVMTGAVLIGPTGEAVDTQLTYVSGEARLAFQVTLPPDAVYEWKLGKAVAPKASDLRIEEDADRLRLSNAHIGIALRKSPDAGAAPIEGIRLRSGVWTAPAVRSGGAAVRDYRMEVTARGPVFAEAMCHVTFADEGTWTLRFRLLSNEPVVLVEESFDAPHGGVISIPMGSAAFRPRELLYRQGKNDPGRLQSWTVSDGQAFLLEPWLRWWMNERQGNWFAVTDGGEHGGSSSNDMLMAGALRPGAWKDPAWKGRAAQLAPEIMAKVEDGIVMLELPLGGGTRHWMLGTPPAAESMASLSAANQKMAPLPQKYLIKYGDFPLDEVKDYVLDWAGDHENYPRLFVKRELLPALRRNLRVERDEVVRWTSRQPIDKYNIEQPLQAWFASHDRALGMAIVSRSEEWLRTVVDDDLLDQHSRVTLGVAPHMQAVLLLPAINLTDAALGCEGLSPASRKRMLARIAFLGYAVNRDDYWSPERGFSANPNMTTTVAHYQTALAALVPSHPLADQWARRGLTELKRQLYAWSDEDGGWLEAPHYAMVSFDHMLGSFLMASNAGFEDLVHDERVKKVSEWLAKISTPRDPRTGGFRHYPPIGNTYMGESTGMFGIVAGLWKDHDPTFASNMQWMCAEHGSPDIGLLGSFGTFAGYKTLLKSHGVAAVAPAWGSEWFRGCGVVLRHGFPRERETFLHLIAGPQREHYDLDSGSVIVWGKGCLLADDFGYIGRHPAQWHSLLTSPAISDDSAMQIEAFAAGAALDYVRGRKDAWWRQIAFSKDADPFGPAGFLLRDTHDAECDATWRLWLTASAISVNHRGAVVTGEDDVDLDIFIYNPQKFRLKTESTLQKGMGRRNGKEGPIEINQTALLATLQGRETLTALLWPRLRNTPSPAVTWLADGACVRVETPDGTDYIHLSLPTNQQGRSAAPAKEFNTSDDRVSFQCAAGCMQLRGSSVTAALATSGTIRYRDHVLQRDSPGQKTF